MGLAESKVVLQKLSNACEYAERYGSCQVDGVLEDPDVSLSLPALIGATATKMA